MAKRRKLPNGFGSISRVKKTASGKPRVNQYRARLPAKKGRKDIGFFKTWNQAFEALSTYEEPIQTETFKDLYIRYTNSKEFKGFTRNTQLRHQRAFERFEEIHDKKINEIFYSDLQEVIDQMEEEGYTETVDGELVSHQYSKSSIDRLKVLVNKIFTLAIKDNLITYNPAPMLEIGGIKNKRVKEIFKEKEIEQLFLSIPDNPDARHILFMIFTGMRTGEYINLKKENIHLEEHTITDFGIKTEEGKKRIMYIHPKIYNIVKELYHESKSGNIVEVDGKALVYDTKFYKHVYYPALKKAGVKRKIPYTCRYTFATIAYYSGVNEKALQKLMGHTNIIIDKEYYIQDKEEMGKYIYQELKKIQ